MSRNSFCRLLRLLPVIFLGACANPGVRVLTRPLAETPEVGALLNPKKLAPETRGYLKEHNLLSTYRKDPGAAIALLRKELSQNPSHANRMTLFEICSDTGEQVAATHPQAAIGYHLAAAELAYEFGHRAENASALTRELAAGYNHSVGRVATLLFQTDPSWNQPVSIKGPWKTYQIHSRTEGRGLANPALFDTLVSAQYLKFKKIKVERIQRDGVGAPLVAHRKGTPERREANPFLPRVGMSLPVTGTLEFRDGGEVELAFHDALIVDEAQIGGRTTKLAADLTAPLALLYNYDYDRKAGWKGMVHPEKYLDQIGLYQLEPFRADQIPVVFVHGLMSSPEIWMEALNKLRRDPQLRKNYQLLVFNYPTGFPIAYNAAALRSRLKEFREHFDPGRRSPRMGNVVLIGHSMGGLLSNEQIRDSGDSFTRYMFDRPIDDLTGIDQEQKEILKTLLEFEASPDVTRAVFVAAPHRGSKIASSPIGNLGRKLIKFPLELLTARPIPIIDGLTEEGRRILEERPDSIDSLKPGASVELVLDLPIRNGVAIHSLIGRKRNGGSLQGSSDGVVPYWSSHLDEATSEVVVQATHNGITKDPEALEEIRRILYLHAGLTE